MPYHLLAGVNECPVARKAFLNLHKGTILFHWISLEFQSSSLYIYINTYNIQILLVHPRKINIEYFKCIIFNEIWNACSTLVNGNNAQRNRKIEIIVKSIIHYQELQTLSIKNKTINILAFGWQTKIHSPLSSEIMIYLLHF